jgi:putative hemolysin
MDNTAIMSIVIAVLIIMSAYFSGTEIAFASLNKVRLKNMANNGNRRAEKALALSENFDRILSTVLIGNNIVNIAAASIATVIFVNFFGEKGAWISTVVMTVLVLIFGEISPKVIAKDASESYAMFSTPILRILMFIFWPLHVVFGLWKKLIAKIIRTPSKKSFTEEELITIVEEAETEGEIDEHESKLIRSAIEFNDLDAEEIITPRVDLVAVPETTAVEEIRQTFFENRFSRLPVYRQSIDHIIGVIHEKDFLRNLIDKKEPIKNIIKPIICASPDVKISVLLRRLQQSKSHMAVIVDEFGGTEGIVTLEDILEELVGEIWDEHDEVIESFTEVEQNKFLVNANTDLDDFFEKFGLGKIPDDFEGQKLSKWVIKKIGHIPNIGDRFTYENLSVSVVKTDYRRVLEIEVELIPENNDNQQ